MSDMIAQTPELTFRRARPEDKPRILEIAAEVWDGEDYIPDVIDDWLAADHAVLVAALAGETLVGFARYVRQWPGYAWFEGLRTAAEWRGRGAAKAMTGYLLALAQADGMARVGLSTYVENLASQRVIAAFGFRRVAGFVYLEAEAEAAARAAADPTTVAVPVTPADALSFITGREATTSPGFLQAAHGFLPQGWMFHPFAACPERIVAEWGQWWGVREDGLRALLGLGRPTHGQQVFTLDYLDGEPAAMTTLARHALRLAAGYAHIEAMAPPDHPALAVLREVGFRAWNDFMADVLVYERDLG
jgi:RimJ/RimL family protein N-acetyltransferase